MIRLEEVTRRFEGPTGTVTAVDRVSLEVGAGEVCVLLGPSGCGKTTTMKMINRLIAPSGGRILIDGRDTDGIDPIELRRGIGYVIQQVGLFPNKTVAQNVCTVPDLLGRDRRASRERAAELLAMVGLDPDAFMGRYPRELSGGQAQRVGVVRALAADPPVLLMDEPFGAIDPIARVSIQDEFSALQRRLGTTVVLVSHDLDEAVRLADRVAILRDGRLEQYDPPAALLARPASGFVEAFLGRDRALKRLALHRVADAMASPGEADGEPVRLEDDLRVALAALMASGAARLPCVDADGRPQGTIDQAAIVRTLARDREPRPVDHEGDAPAGRAAIREPAS